MKSRFTVLLLIILYFNSVNDIVVEWKVRVFCYTIVPLSIATILFLFMLRHSYKVEW